MRRLSVAARRRLRAGTAARSRQEVLGAEVAADLAVAAAASSRAASVGPSRSMK